MAGKYNSAAWTFQMDDGPGGTLRTYTAFALAIGGVKLVSKMENVTPMGVSYEAFLPAGMVSVGPFTGELLWDTTATTGTHVGFLVPDDGTQDATRTCTISPGDSKSLSGEGYLVDFEPIFEVGKITRMKFTYQPTGTWAWA